MGLCSHCANTGSLSKALDGHLDCAHCPIAEQRVALAEELDRIKPEPGPARDWLAFQLGRLSEGNF
jgi:hypothetical protein